MQETARSAIQELARGLGTGIALWGGASKCPDCNPQLHCQAPTPVVCQCAGVSWWTVFASVALLAAALFSAFLAGAVCQQRSFAAPVPHQAETDIGAEARRQTLLIRRRALRSLE